MRDPHERQPALLQTQFFHNVGVIASSLLAVEETRLQMGWRIFLKLPAAGETPWHQDAAYHFSPFSRSSQSVNIWMSLDPATQEQGCLQFIAGSQHGKLLPHVLQHDGNLVARVADPIQALACPLAASKSKDFSRLDV